MSDASIIKEFLVALGFKVDEGGMSRFETKIGTAAAAVATIGAAISAAAVGLLEFEKHLAEPFDELENLAYLVNTSTEDIMRLGYVAGLTDSSMAAVTSSLRSLSMAAGDAKMGIGRAKLVFEQMHISVTDANGKLKDTTVLMDEIAEKIKPLERGQQLTVLSRLGIDPSLLHTMLSDTSDVREEFDKLYKSLGVDLNESAAKSKEFMDANERLSFSLTAIKQAVGLKFMGRVQEGLDSVRKFIVENAPKIVAALAPIIDILLRMIEAFLILAKRAGDSIAWVIDFLARLDKATGGWSTAILAAAAAWKILNLGFMASPLGRLITLAAVVALLIDDFLTWKEGGESLINWGNSFYATLGALAVAAAAFWLALSAPLGAIFVAVVGLGVAIYSLKDKWQPMLDYVGDKLLSWKNAINDLIDLIGGKLAAAWQKLKDIGGSISGALGFGDEPQPGLARAGSFQGGNAGLLPSPSQAATIDNSRASQNINQKTEIIVQGGNNPDATGRAVAGQQDRVNADMTRNMRGAVR